MSGDLASAPPAGLLTGVDDAVAPGEGEAVADLLDQVLAHARAASAARAGAGAPADPGAPATAAEQLGVPAGIAVTLTAADGSGVVTGGRLAAPLAFGYRDDARVRARDVTLDDEGRVGFVLVHDDAAAPVALELLGVHAARAALAAAAAALASGVGLAEVTAGLAAVRHRLPHRMRRTEHAGGITVLDDAGRTLPAAVRDDLRTLAVVAGRARRSVAVIGPLAVPDDPQATLAEHDALGRLAVRLDIDLLIAVGEEALPVHVGAAHEGSWGDETVHVPDPGDLPEVLRTSLAAGDVVLVAGRVEAGVR